MNINMEYKLSTNKQTISHFIINYQRTSGNKTFINYCKQLNFPKNFMQTFEKMKKTNLNVQFRFWLEKFK